MKVLERVDNTQAVINPKMIRFTFGAFLHLDQSEIHYNKSQWQEDHKHPEDQSRTLLPQSRLDG